MVNISINGRDLLKLVQKHADEFEVNKVQNNIILIKLKKVVAPAINESSAGNGSYIKDMIELQQAEFFGNDTNFVNSHIQENIKIEHRVYSHQKKTCCNHNLLFLPRHRPKLGKIKPKLPNLHSLRAWQLRLSSITSGNFSSHFGLF